MFCKICYDMNLPASKYTTHCVKFGDKVTCPELRKMECFTCKKLGHTRSHCPLLKPKISPIIKPIQKPIQKPILKPVQKPIHKNTNVFSALIDSDDEEIVVEEIPDLSRATNSHEIKKQWKMGFSWADEMDD